MTAVLLDTHVWLWLLATPERLDAAALGRVRDAAHRYLSIASIWELSIKASIGRFDAAMNQEWFHGRMRRSGVTLLPATVDHVVGVAGLPLLHRDPFDRLIVSQGMAEGMTVVTRDERVAAYDVDVIHA